MGSSLGPIGEVDVFQSCQRFSGIHGVIELGGQVTVFFERFKDDFAPFVEFTELFEAVPNCGNGDFVETACNLFTVAGDEWDRCALIDEGSGAFDLAEGDVELFGDQLMVPGVHLAPGLKTETAPSIRLLCRLLRAGTEITEKC